MRLGRYRLRAPWWAFIVTLLGVALFARLGVWQIHRGDEKNTIIAARQQAAKANAVDLGAWLRDHDDVAPLYRQPVMVRGHLQGARQFLHDNQVAHGVPGYEVWTPMRLAGADVVVLVNRGWVPMNPDRSIRPDPAAPEGVVSLRGMLRDFPEPGLRLAETGCEPPSSWPAPVLYPRRGDLQCLFERPLVNGIVLLDPGAPYGFQRQWAQFGIRPVRHYGYAFQWFAMAVAVVGVFLVVNTRRDRNHE